MSSKIKIFDWKVFNRNVIVSIGENMLSQTISTEVLIALIPIVLIELALTLYALYDWFKQPKLENRYIWLIIILVVGTIGPLLYFWKAPRGEKLDI